MRRDGVRGGVKAMYLVGVEAGAGIAGRGGKRYDTAMFV